MIRNMHSASFPIPAKDDYTLGSYATIGFSIVVPDIPIFCSSATGEDEVAGNTISIVTPSAATHQDVSSGSGIPNESTVTANSCYLFPNNNVAANGDRWISHTCFSMRFYQALEKDNDAGASNITATSATLHGTLTSTSDAETSVYVYWGLIDLEW